MILSPLTPSLCLSIMCFLLQVYHFVPSSRLLVCTPSNSAADLICIRLHHSGFLDAASLARVNASCRQDEVLLCFACRSPLDFRPNIQSQSRFCLVQLPLIISSTAKVLNGLLGTFLFVTVVYFSSVHPRSVEIVLKGRRRHSSCIFSQDCCQHLFQRWHVP